MAAHTVGYESDSVWGAPFSPTEPLEVDDAIGTVEVELPQVARSYAFRSNGAASMTLGLRTQLGAAIGNATLTPLGAKLRARMMTP